MQSSSCDPTISVIIPAFNSRDSLDTAIQSVLTQSHSVMEIIVVDDYSQPPLRNHFGKLVKFVRNKKNLGPAVSRNLGAKLAIGDFISFWTLTITGTLTKFKVS